MLGVPGGAYAPPNHSSPVMTFSASDGIETWTSLITITITITTIIIIDINNKQ